MSTSFEFESELVRRYDVAGPRYTSYPTAAEFTDTFDARDYARAVRLGNFATQAAPLSLYVHVPFCQSLCYYCGCNKIVTRHRERFDPYIDRVLKEARMHAALVDTARPVRQLHFGGGTPTYLNIDQLKRLVDGLSECFDIDKNAEQSIEIDPRTVDTEYVYELKRLGFNRISLGVQDLNITVQRAVNRIQPLEQVKDVIHAARKSAYDSVSLDLIYGLPAQTKSSFRHTLNQVIQLRPDRLAIYNYAHLPQRFRAQRLIDAEQIPRPAHKLEILELAMSMLDTAGFWYIGMDHFAMPDDSLSKAMLDSSLHRSFQGYSTHASCDLVGLGVSAISNPHQAFAQNTREIKKWEQAIDAGRLAIRRGLSLTRDDLIRADVIDQIMCRSELRPAELGARWEIEFSDYFSDELASLAPLIQDGLVKPETDGFSVTPRGRLLLRIIARVFDKYRAGAQSAQFSKVI